MRKRFYLAAWIVASFTCICGAQANFGSASISSARLSPNYLTNALSDSVLTLFAGKTTNTAWAYSPASTTTWIHPVDLSGLAITGVNGNAAERDLCLITPSYCITCAHAWTIGGNNGKRVVFTDSTGVNWTNSVANDNVGSSDDVQLVLLASNAPPQIKPFWLLPSNYTNYAPLYLDEVIVAYYENDTGNMNIHRLTRIAGPPSEELCANLTYDGQFDVAPYPWYSYPATGGDSGSPVIAVLNGKAILLCSVHFSIISGSSLSYPTHLSFLQSNCTNQLSFVDLSQFQTVQ